MSLFNDDLGPLRRQLHRIEGKLDLLLAHAGLATQPPEPAWLGEVRTILRGGDKIEAIKLYRAHSGVGLKEAKDAVEAMD